MEKLKKQVDVLALPTDVTNIPTYTKGLLVKCIKEWTPVGEDTIRIGTWSLSVNHSKGVLDYYQPHHLYFLSNEKIKEGDWVVDFYGLPKEKEHEAKVWKVDRINAAHPCNLKGCKKIIATTNPELWNYEKKLDSGMSTLTPQKDFISKYKIGVAKIPEDFIQSWVKSNGSIDKVLVGYKEAFYYGKSRPQDVTTRIAPYEELDLNNSGQVKIYPVEEKLYTREEMNDAVLQACAGVISGSIYSVQELQSWFDKMYPVQ